jgi:bifunctional non-homologous end joining protein LigD
LLEGVAVVLGVDGISDFNALHSCKHDTVVQFCAFDPLVDGDDLRKLHDRCARPTFSGYCPECIFANPFDGGEVGSDSFRAMGLDGLVSKQRADYECRPPHAYGCKLYASND